MEENKHLQLLDVLGIPSIPKDNTPFNILFSHKEKTLTYSLGSNIIHYNLKKDSKTFLQYFSSNISLLKFINDSETILLIITNSSFPILSIWQIPSFIGIYSQEITTQPNFETGEIFLEKINPITYLILITSKNNNSDNFLYSLNLSQNGKFDLNFFGKLKYIITKINGFNVFYNTDEIVFLMSHNLQYYSIDLKNEKCIQKKNINFSFKLKENTVRISPLNDLLCVLTTKGNCLIYDQNGVNKPTINPLGQECFSTCEFCGNSLCLGTSHGNVYVYNIYGFHLKYMISYIDISNIKNLSLINKNNNTNNINKFDSYIIDNEIIFITINESLDQIFIIFKDNSFVFMSIKKLLNQTKYNYNTNSLKTNSITFYSFNHCNQILDISINPQIKNNCNNIVFYTCSKDNKIIKYYLEQNTDKLQNQYYNISHILSNTKPNNTTKNYFTVLKMHPLFNNKLFAGDNKGFLYIINLNIEKDINENISNIKYRKYNIGTFEIVSLSFSKSGNLLCIGFETGYQLIYKTNKIFECVLKLSEHYLNIENIEERKSNKHLLAYCYFLNHKKNKHCVIYTKSHNIIEYAKLYKTEDGLSLYKKKIMNMIIKNTVLDIAMHQSENCIIILNDKKQIIINNIFENKTTAIIDLNTQINKIFNFQIDISGLYLAIVCNMKNKNKININNSDKTDLIIIEINTSQVKNYIIKINPISKIIFDNIGKYLIIGGDSGEISLWRLPGEMTSEIKNILCEIENDVNFWDKYEIRYNNNVKEKNKNKYKDVSLFSNSDSDTLNDKEKLEESNNNKYKTYLTTTSNNRNNIKSMNKNHYSQKYFINDINDLNNKVLKTYNFKENKNKYTENGLYKNIRNKSHKFFNQNINKNYNDRNYFLNNGNIKQINNRYNFWSQTDTINVKKSYNVNGNHKYPEPEDIDDYLFKRSYK